MMKKRIISIIVAIAAIGAAAVTSAVIKRNSNTILNQNVEALMDGEIIIGDMCAWDPLYKCYPFRLYGDNYEIAEHYQIISQ